MTAIWYLTIMKLKRNYFTPFTQAEEDAVFVDKMNKPWKDDQTRWTEYKWQEKRNKEFLDQEPTTICQ